MRYFALTLASLFFVINLSGQSKTYGATAAPDFFRLPLDLVPNLSGSYGELRATHFHAGLDFRTGGVVGARISAAGEGYICKITVSPFGYGNAIYIRHTNGKTTVYGHLLDFAPKVAGWVKKKQYESESFAVSLEPDSTLFPVNKGDLIGRTGNSGSSGGPHLHFEIRDTEKQIPLDPVKEGNFKITDNIAPLIRRVSFFAISNAKTLPVTALVKSFTEPSAIVTALPDTFYVAVDAIDRMNNTSARLAVANYNYYLDNEKIFSFTPVAIPFDKGRYINALVDYCEKQQYGRSMVKSWVEPGNGLVSNIKAKNNGLFVLSDDNEHTVMVETLDYKGNRATRSFKVKRGGVNTALPVKGSFSNANGKIMPWFIANSYESGSMKLTLPIGSLYSSILFTADSSIFRGAKMWRVGDEVVPLQVYGKLSLKPEIKPELRNKAVIVVVGKNGRYGSLGGEWKGEYLETSIGSFGKFLVTVDTLAPKIFPFFKEGMNVSTRKALKISISDDLSGIGSYKVQIDGKWILANFDGKTGSLTVDLDADKITKGKAHIMTVTVGDNRGNVNTVNTSFVW